jgi:hypothetical protein
MALLKLILIQTNSKHGILRSHHFHPLQYLSHMYVLHAMLAARTLASTQFVQVLVILSPTFRCFLLPSLLLYPAMRSTLTLNCPSLGALTLKRFV